MNLKLIISDDCEACERAKAVMDSIKFNNPLLEIETIHKDSFSDGRIAITPALLIDDKLFSYGDIDPKRLFIKIGKK